MTDSELEYVCRLVEQTSGVFLTPEKSYLIESRLSSLVKREKLGSIEALVKKLKWSRHGDLHDYVVDALTTNETFFFRDQAPFDALYKVIVPALLKANAASKTIRIWSAACSSGQEPYSIAMLLYHHFPFLSDWNLEILGTDISKEMLAKARRGYYSAFEVQRGLPAELLHNFEKSGRGWQMKQQITDIVRFEFLNLIEPWPPLQNMDIIFMRNVLIYFKPEVKKEILSKVHTVMKPSGHLFLGQSETVVQLDTRFEAVNIEAASCYQMKSHQQHRLLKMTMG